jgi:hypothetical protein
MITIMCWYIACPGGKFDWSESTGYVLAQPGELGAEWKSAICPHCNHTNWIFVKCEKELRLPVPKLGPVPKDQGPRVVPIPKVRGPSAVPIPKKDQGPKKVPIAMAKGYRRSGRFEP